MRFLKILCAFACISITDPGQAQGDNTDVVLRHFDRMANYLSRGSGKWRGENKNYDPANPNSPQAYGLWFERPLKYLLTIKIVAYLKDTISLSSQGIFSWHPQKKSFIHITTDRGNGLSEGISEFPNDSTFISTMMIYRPNGKVFSHKDENTIVSKDVHRNTSLKKNAEGKWIETGNWTWIRDPHEMDATYHNQLVMNDTTPGVTGIGGIFFRSKNPKLTREWYGENLGLAIDDYGSAFEFRNANRPEETNYLRWSPFEEGSEYFQPSEKEFMINYRVQNIEGLVKNLRKNGVTIVDQIDEFEYGKFVHIMDPEGNKIELWEPVDGFFTEMGGVTTK